MSAKRFGDWAGVKRAFGSAQHLSQAISKAVRTESRLFHQAMKRGLRSGGPDGSKFQKLKPLTLAARKFRGHDGRKILRETDEMLNHLQQLELDRFHFFIGFPAGSQRSNGQSMVSLALRHENGAEINIDLDKLSPEKRKKALAWLFMTLRELGIKSYYDEKQGTIQLSEKKVHQIMQGKKILHIVIPARPFLEPVMNDYMAHIDQAKERIYESIQKSMEKVWGEK